MNIEIKKCCATCRHYDNRYKYCRTYHEGICEDMDRWEITPGLREAFIVKDDPLADGAVEEAAE